MIIALLAFLLLGEDAGQLVNMIGGGQPAPIQSAPPPTGGASDELADFVSVVLGETENAWSAMFASNGLRYVPPKLVLFTDAVESACGFNSSATGPFYCPGDSKVYIDLGFLGELQRLGAKGDFALAYVIAHEIGHHVQNVLGTEAQVRRLRSRVSRADANALSVLVELQADCYAGLWARRLNDTRDMLDEGDIEEGLNAASAIGDDRLQRMAGRRIQPEAFTHGSSAQRMQWFRRGFQSRSIEACDTFEAAGL